MWGFPKLRGTFFFGGGGVPYLWFGGGGGVPVFVEILNNTKPVFSGLDGRRPDRFGTRPQTEG